MDKNIILSGDGPFHLGVAQSVRATSENATVALAFQLQTTDGDHAWFYVNVLNSRALGFAHDIASAAVQPHSAKLGPSPKISKKKRPPK